jgi:hypothetical protein
MLPPTNAFFPAFSRMWPMRVVTVVFPFVPVMAMTGTRRNRKASSTSLTTGMPRFSASRSSGL